MGGVALAGADRLIVREKVSIINLLPVSYEARMDRIPGVDFSTHQTWFGGIYQDPKNFFMQNPVEPEKFLKMHPEIILPPDEEKAWLATRTGAIVGRRTAERFGWKIGDKVPIRSTIWTQPDGSQAWTFDIVGIYDGKDKGTDTTPMFFRYDYFDEARQQWGKGQVGWYTIRIKDPSQAAEVAKRVDAEFENSPAETKTEPEGAFIQGWASQLGNIVFIVAAILSAVFFTILLVTGNTMAQAVRERTGELGVLKAIGFTNAPGRCARVGRIMPAHRHRRSGWPGTGAGHHARRRPKAGGIAAHVLSAHTRFVHRIRPQHCAGPGYGNFSRAPGHAPAGRGCLKENVK